MRQALTKIFNQTIGGLILIIKSLFFNHKIKSVKDGTYYVEPIPPYVSQLAGAKKTKIDRFYGSINDQTSSVNFGAKDLSEFSYWSWRSCGIAAIQMVLLATNSKFNKKTMELVSEGLALGGYYTREDIGWYHQSLLKLAEAYGLFGKLEKFVPSSEISNLILNGNYVLVSVKSKRGGHILLVYGVVVEGGQTKKFIFHDPNDYETKGEGRQLTSSLFEKISTHRIISLKAKDLKDHPKHKNNL